MKNKLVSIFLFFCVFFNSAVFFSAHAQNNDSLDVGTCEITVNGTSAPYTATGNEPAANIVPLVAASSIGVFDATYGITVRLGEYGIDELTRCRGLDGPLQLRSNTGWYNWDETSSLLKQSDGTFTGTFTIGTERFPFTEFTENRIMGLDIETPEAGVANCLGNVSLCRRAYVRLEPDETVEETAVCDAAIEQLEADFRATVPDAVAPNQVIQLSLPSLSEYFTDCGDVAIAITVRSNRDGNELKHFNILSVNPTIESFSLSAYGDYTVGIYPDGENNIFYEGLCVAEGGNCLPPEDTPLSQEKKPYDLCKQLPEGSEERAECCKCAGGNERCEDNPTKVGGVWTAIGCIETDPTKMTSTIMKVALSLAGGVTILVILGAGFLFSTSQGDPKRTSEAKEMLTSAVVGLLFIIFSVTILTFIGVDILQIPGFGTP